MTQWIKSDTILAYLFVLEYYLSNFSNLFLSLFWLELLFIFNALAKLNRAFFFCEIACGGATIFNVGRFFVLSFDLDGFSVLDFIDFFAADAGTLATGIGFGAHLGWVTFVVIRRPAVLSRFLFFVRMPDIVFDCCVAAFACTFGAFWDFSNTVAFFHSITSLVDVQTSHLTT